jgi:hypothetical protein
MNKLTRTLHPEVKILDPRAGIVQYIASDESIDSYREVIRADGWRFNHFAKNSPFVDSHNYDSITSCLGKVIDFRIEDAPRRSDGQGGPRLLETVQWAIDVPENQLAQIGWKMTAAGYLKAVSVGFWPLTVLTPQDGRQWQAQLAELGLDKNNPPRAIYTEQEQVELSCCIIGANPNALAKCVKAGVLSPEDCKFAIENFQFSISPLDKPPCLQQSGPGANTAQSAYPPALADWASEQALRQFLDSFRDAMSPRPSSVARSAKEDKS